MSRYPGTRPFSDSAEDVARFFGREAEAEELYLRVLSVPLLVQFGNSGLGKTSLLQAGLFPRLRQKPFLPVMIRLNNTGESLTDAVERAIRESCASEGIEPSYRSTEGLWELLSSLTVWRDDLLLTPVLVFDQFEEVFTLRDAAFRSELASELGALASGIPPARAAGTRRPMVKVLISLREDYLGALEEFSAAIPGLFQERLRLAPLTEEAARDAITGPARIPPPFELEPAALDLMIDELQGKSGIIEPFQLQLLARHAETIADRKGGGRLTVEDFRGTQDFESVLKNFYRGTLQSVAQRGKARRLIEEGLLGASGHRLMLEERQIRSDYGVTPETLRTLEDSRLIRRERRLESVFYEISHDRLADSIFRNRTRRLPRNVRVALWAAGLVAITIVAGLIVFNQRVARERDRSEQFISFLLGEEFLGEVRDIGRLSLLDLVHDNVEPGERSPMNRALARRNAGDVARAKGRLQESIDELRGALTILEGERGDDTGVARELARTHERLIEAVTEHGNVTDAVTHSDAAVAAWERVTATHAAPKDDCIGLAGALVKAADARQRIGQTDVALRDLDRASHVVLDLLFGARTRDSHCGPPAAAEPYPDGATLDMLSRIIFARATYLGYAQDFDGAVALAESARKLRLTSSEVEKHALNSTLVRGQVTQSLPDYRSSMTGFRDLSRWDPENRLWQREAAAAQLHLSVAIVTCHFDPDCDDPGTLDEAEVLALQALATMRTLLAIDRGNESWQDDVAWGVETHANVLAARGLYDEAQRRLDEAERISAAVTRDPADSAPAFYAAHLQRARARAFAAAGDRTRAAASLRDAAAILGRLDEAQPQNLAVLQDLSYVHELQWELLDDASGRTMKERMEQRRNAALAKIDAPIAGIDATAAVQFRRAQQLVAPDRAAALRELRKLEETVRQRIILHPADAPGYATLRILYEALAMPSGKERGSALQAAVHAARIAHALAPGDLEAATAARDATYNLAMFLDEEKRLDEAVVVIREAIALAEEVTGHSEADATSWGYLGKSECNLGRMRRESGRPSWQEALAGGIIHLRRAAELDPRFAGELRTCTAYAATTKR